MNARREPRDRFFEDWQVGDVVVAPEPYVMEAGRMMEFAREFDAQPFHTDPLAAADSTFGGLIASGWHTGSAMMSRIASLLGEASLGAAGVDELRWHAPVRPGDTLTLTFTVIEKRRSVSKPDRGLMRVREEFTNQTGDTVMSMIALMFLSLRAPDLAK